MSVCFKNVEVTGFMGQLKKIWDIMGHFGGNMGLFVQLGRLHKLYGWHTVQTGPKHYGRATL